MLFLLENDLHEFGLNCVRLPSLVPVITEMFLLQVAC